MAIPEIAARTVSSTGGPSVKIEIQQEDLQQALDIVANVVPAKTTLPILTCVLMDVADGRLTLSATNLDISITTSTDAVEVKDAGKVAVPALKIVPFVRSLRSGSVTIAQKGEQITLTSGKSRLTENTMDVKEYPKLKTLEEKDGLDVEARVLIDMVNETSYSVSRDETRPALMGILWEVRPESLTLVATDAHRLARSMRRMDWVAAPTGKKKGREIAGEGESVTPDQRDMIVDTAGLRHLPRIVAAGQDDEKASANVTVFMGENQLSFRCGPTVLHTRLLEGPFPDYNAVIPRDNDKDVTVDKADFAEAIRRVSITADRITSQIKLGIEKGRMELAARGTEGSQSEDEIEVAYDGAALEIGFNYNYLQDILKNIRSEQVVLSLKDAQSAALIKPIDEEGAETGVLCLLMPLRLTGD
jgi:DNA polymerase-3 subunit beta